MGMQEFSKIPSAKHIRVLPFFRTTKEHDENKRPNRQDPPMSPVVIDPEILQLNEEIVQFASKKSKPKPRLTIRKQWGAAFNGIFSNPVKSKLIEIAKSPQPSVASPKITVSTSSIYVSNDSPSTDYENELFKEPSNMDLASFYHNQYQNSQWFQDFSFQPQPPVDDSNYYFGSLEFDSKSKSNFKLYSQPF